jgi:trimethylamine:corrinoid methyltransferase-like protein
MKSYSAQIAAIIARELLRKSRKKFATLHANAIEELKMSTDFSKTSCTTTGVNVADTESARVAIGRPETLETVARLAPAAHSDSVNSGMNSQPQISAPVAKPTGRITLEGSTPGDHRSPNSGAGVTDEFKSQAGPRGEIGTKGC